MRGVDHADLVVPVGHGDRDTVSRAGEDVENRTDGVVGKPIDRRVDVMTCRREVVRFRLATRPRGSNPIAPNHRTARVAKALTKCRSGRCTARSALKRPRPTWPRPYADIISR